MKKKIFSFALITVLVSSLFNIKTTAQEIKLGGGLVIGTELPPLGLQFKGTYGMDMVLENLSGSVEFAIFFPSTQNNIKHSRWTLDFDGNYTFWSATGFDFYGIAGLNISHYAKKYTGPLVGVGDVIGTKPGLNVGAGVNFAFNQQLTAFSEVKYILSNYDQAAFNVGVLFEL